MSQNYEEFIQELITQNADIEEELGVPVADKIRVIAKMACMNIYKENWILQAPPEVAKWFLKKQQVNFDLVKVHVQEHFNVAICFKCSLFGHVAKHCKNKQCCHRCGGEHFGKQCVVEEMQCPNCEKFKLDTRQHSARDANCPIYKKTLERYKCKIKYSTTTTEIFLSQQ